MAYTFFMEDKIKKDKKACGILLAISSLPGNHGIGDFGKSAYEFIDLLVKSNMLYWEILPINPIDEYNSPYMSCSINAGEELYIDLSEFDQNFIVSDKVDYKEIKVLKRNILFSAYSNFKEDNEYFNFLDDNKWLNEYCCFMSEIDGFYEYHLFVQYLFFKQYNKLKEYANTKGIKIIGDVPLYVSYYSHTVNAHPELFLLNEDFKMELVSGASPDYFNHDGQVWNHPLYNYCYMKLDNYQWWINRLTYNSKLFDVIRIDHFRGFDEFYVVENGSDNARDGFYLEGPGENLLNEVIKKVSSNEIIVEDLGDITESVVELKSKFDLRGMEVVQFNEPFKLINYNDILYSGTHDNGMMIDWINSNELSYEDIINYIFMSDSSLVILNTQDILQLDSSHRMNTPGTHEGNWEFKLKDLKILDSKLFYFKELILRSSRI